MLKDWSPETMTMSLVRRHNGRDPKRIEQVIAFLKAKVGSFAQDWIGPH